MRSNVVAEGSSVEVSAEGTSPLQPADTHPTASPAPVVSTDDSTTVPTTALASISNDVLRPNSKPKPNLSTLNQLFGRRTKLFESNSSPVLLINQKHKANQGVMSSFGLRKIALKRQKQLSNNLVDTNELQKSNIQALERKQAAGIQQEQLVQQQIRLELQKQELLLNRLEHMQTELQQQQEKRQKELLQRQQERQEALHIQQEQQLAALKQEQQKQLQELQKQQRQEQEEHLKELRQQKGAIGALQASSLTNVLPSPLTEVVTQQSLQLIASAPLTPATSRFIAVPAVPTETEQNIRNNNVSGFVIAPSPSTQKGTLRKSRRQGRSRHRAGHRRFRTHVKSRPQNAARALPQVNSSAPLPAKIRAFATPSTSTNTVATGFFTFPSAGIAYNF